MEQPEDETTMRRHAALALLGIIALLTWGIGVALLFVPAQASIGRGLAVVGATLILVFYLQALREKSRADV